MCWVDWKGIKSEIISEAKESDGNRIAFAHIKDDESWTKGRAVHRRGEDIQNKSQRNGVSRTYWSIGCQGEKKKRRWQHPSVTWSHHSLRQILVENWWLVFRTSRDAWEAVRGGRSSKEQHWPECILIFSRWWQLTGGERVIQGQCEVRRGPRKKHTWKIQHLRHTQQTESMVGGVVENWDRSKEGKERTV